MRRKRALVGVVVIRDVPRKASRIAEPMTTVTGRVQQKNVNTTVVILGGSYFQSAKNYFKFSSVATHI